MDISANRAGSSKGKFLFIVDDGKKTKSKHNRRLINAHSQSQFHVRRRQTEAELFQSTSGTRLSGLGIVGRRHEALHSWQSLGQGRDQASTSSDSSLSSRDSTPESSIDGGLPQRPTSPVTILNKGNSDPFGTYPIPIDSTVTRLMTFHRDCLLPSVHVFGVPFMEEPFSRSVFLEDVAHDECTGYANLSYYAAMEASVTGDHLLSLKASSFRNEATAQLRERLKKQGRADENTLYWSIPALMGAEFAAGNYHNAILHGRMLRLLWQGDGRENKGMQIELQTLEGVLYLDIQRSSMSLTRPSFDLDGWVAAQIHASVPRGPQIPEISSWHCQSGSAVRAAIDDPILVLTFNDLIGLLAIFNSLRTRAELFDGSNFLWLSTRGLICEGRLINHYLDLAQILERQSGQLWSGQKALVAFRACVALAALYWVRRATCTEGAGTDGRLSQCGDLVHYAGPLILEHMDRVFPHSEGYVDKIEFSAPTLPPSPGPRARLRLWVLYMATIAEESQAPGSRYAEMPFSKELRTQRVYATKFAKQARDLLLSSWSQIEAVLRGFLYMDGMSTCGPEWFDRSMAALESSEQVG